MSRSRKAKQDSVLRKQKPKSQKHRRRSGWTRVWLSLVALTFLILGSLAIFRQDWASLFFGTNHRARIDPSSWEVNVRSSNQTDISEQSKSEVADIARRHLDDGSRNALLTTAKAIQRIGSYADVRVTKISPRQIIVSLIKREPIFCVEADKIRFVSSHGDIYGQVEKTPGETCPGPTLSGLFEERSQTVFGEDQTMIIDEQTRTTLQEALILLQDLKAKGIKLEHFQVQKFRGFVGELATGGTEVALGRAPFGEKLEKLTGILEKLAVRQEQAQRIELDYQGKAFVKLKKM